MIKLNFGRKNKSCAFRVQCTKDPMGYAILHANYIKNHMHTCSLWNKMPYEMVHSKKPNLHDTYEWGKDIYSDSKNPFHTNPKCGVRSALPYRMGILLSFGGVIHSTYPWLQDCSLGHVIWCCYSSGEHIYAVATMTMLVLKDWKLAEVHIC